MSTKKQTQKEDKRLQMLCVLLSAGIREVHGEQCMPPTTISALTSLLVKKGIVTPDEIRQSFVDTVKERDPQLVKNALEFMKEKGIGAGFPACKNCGKDCEYIGTPGTPFSVYCTECNKKNAAQKRNQRTARKGKS